MNDNLSEIEDNIINCIKDNGKVQKQKLIDILCGVNEYISSPFWGIYKDSSLPEISTRIDTLIRNNILIVNDLFETLTVNINELSKYETEKPINSDYIEDANILKAIQHIICMRKIVLKSLHLFAIELMNLLKHLWVKNCIKNY